MLWDESSLPNSPGSVLSSMTVKVRVSYGQGPASRGWPVALGVETQESSSSFPAVCLHRSQGQNEDPGSLLTFFRHLSNHRGKERSLLHGDFHVLTAEFDFFAYVRQWDQNKRFLVVLNFGDVGQHAMLGASGASLPASVDVLLSTQPGRKEGTSLKLEHLKLEPHEGLLLHFPYVA